MSEYNVSVSGGVQDLNVPLHGHLGVEIRQYPVVPNPEGEATEEIYKMGIAGVVYEVKDAKARATLPTKVDKEEGKGLSENDFTNTLKSKLDHIENGAEANVQSDFGQTNSSADDFIKNKPTKLSDFTNDEGFISNAVNNLVNYYLKSETYTQAEVNTLIGAISTITIEVVESLPTTDIQTNVIYLTPKNPGEPDNIYDEYINVDGTSAGWEKIGDTEIDLSNYYTKSEADSLLNAKVNKVEGKGLSKNDYTDADKALVGTITDKLDKTENAIRSNALAFISPTNDTAPYTYRQTPVKESFKALMKKIVGASVVWNQLVQNGNFASKSGWELSRLSLSVENNVGTLTATEVSTQSLSRGITSIPIGHKLFVNASYKASVSNSKLSFSLNKTSFGNSVIFDEKTVSTNWETVSTIFQTDENTNGVRIGYRGANSIAVNETLLVKNIMICDLTAMFGTTIADYVYTLEQATAGSGIAWLQSYGFFTEDYYAYKQNKLESGCVSAHKTYDGETLLTNTELSPITIRGLLGLSNGKLTVNGDEYYANDGLVKRKCAEIDLGDYTWRFNDFGDNSYFDTSVYPYGSERQPYCFSSMYIWVDALGSADTKGNMVCRIVNTYNLRIRNLSYTDATTFKNAMTGVKLIYDLNTGATTEQTTPFTETEIVGSTEEFIDYEVAQSNRDVAIPVGTDTDYYQEMKLPPLPTTSGNHNLVFNPASGFSWS